jgi:hypothetical protein
MLLHHIRTCSFNALKNSFYVYVIYQAPFRYLNEEPPKEINVIFLLLLLGKYNL